MSGCYKYSLVSGIRPCRGKDDESGLIDRNTTTVSSATGEYAAEGDGDKALAKRG